MATGDKKRAVMTDDINDSTGSYGVIGMNKKGAAGGVADLDENGKVPASELPDYPAPYSSDPEMDGTASPGSSENYAKGDHVHPHDTSKQDALTFDNAPTKNSNNPVKSSGLYIEVNEDTSPYVFRKTGGGVECENSEVLTELVGGTVAWNQLLYNGNFSSTDGWSSTKTITASNNKLLLTGSDVSSYASLYNSDVFTNRSDHKYLFHIRCTSTDKVTVLPSGAAIDGIIRLTTDGSDNYFIWSSSDSSITVRMGIRVTPVSPSTSVEATFEDAFIIDLTQMFGTAIADYIYSLEQTNAGAGVAFFRNLFPNAYYRYDVGSIQSACVMEHNTVGFNQWDEQWEIGSLNVSTGAKTATSNCIRSKNYIPVLPDTTYYFKSPKGRDICYYDANQNFIIGDNTGSSNAEFTTPANAQFMLFRISNTYGTAYTNDICINISNPSFNGTYKSYEKHTYPVSLVELHGIPKLDSNNKLYYDGDRYQSDGRVVRKYGIVDLGTLTWSYEATWGSNTNLFYNTSISNIKPAASNSSLINAVCPKYVLKTRNENNASSEDMVFSCSDTGVIQFINHSYSNTATFKTAMSGVYLVYEVENPTEGTADPFTSNQFCNPDGTEEFVDQYVYNRSLPVSGNSTLKTRDVSIPVGHRTKYPVGYAADIAQAFMPITSRSPETEVLSASQIAKTAQQTATAAQQMMAPILQDPAGQAVSTGQYFIYDNVLRKALQAISSSATAATFTGNTYSEVVSDGGMNDVSKVGRAVAIGQMSSETNTTVNLTNGYKGLLVTIGTRDECCSMYIINVTNAGAPTVYAVRSASGVSLTVSTRQVKITNTSGNAIFPFLISFAPDYFTVS